MQNSKLISRSQFGRDMGVDEKQVRRWIKAGKLPDREDKLLPASLADPELKKPNRGRVERSDKSDSVRPDESPEEAALRLVIAEGNAPHSLPEAVRIKENFLAKLKELEYDLKSGEIARVSTMVRLIATQGASVRTRILSVPSEVAPIVAILNNPSEVEAALTTALNEALDMLAVDLAKAAKDLRDAIQAE